MNKIRLFIVTAVRKNTKSAFYVQLEIASEAFASEYLRITDVAIKCNEHARFGTYTFDGYGMIAIVGYDS